jgi:hypothetical protein
VNERPTRIDAFERELDDLIELLQFAKANVRDLHTLAYDRKVAASERVSGSGPANFYLDSHGDLRARRAMWVMMDALTKGADALTTAALDAKQILTEGQPPRRGTITIKATEHAEALAARARRVARGEYTPHRNWPQPQPDLTDVALSAEQRTVARKALEAFAATSTKAAANETDPAAKERHQHAADVARRLAGMLTRAQVRSG